jgi:hypothetical protein
MRVRRAVCRPSSRPTPRAPESRRPTWRPTPAWRAGRAAAGTPTTRAHVPGRAGHHQRHVRDQQRPLGPAVRVNLDSTAASLYLTTPDRSRRIPVTAGQPITASVDVKHELANRKIDAVLGCGTTPGTPPCRATSHSYSVPDTGAANTVLAGLGHRHPTGWRGVGLPDPDQPSPSPAASRRLASGSGSTTCGVSSWARHTGRHQPVPEPRRRVGSATYWQSNNTALFPVSADATAPISGKYSAMTTRTATSPSRFPGSISLTGTSTGSDASPVRRAPGSTRHVTSRPSWAGRRVETYYQWFNAAGSYIGTGARGTYTTLSAGQAVRAKYSEVPPAGAVLCQPVVEVSTVNSSLVGAGERVWFDNAAVGASDLPAFSGYTAPDGTYVYRWTGTGWASASERWKVSGTAADRHHLLRRQHRLPARSSPTTGLARSTLQAPTVRLHRQQHLQGDLAAPAGVPATDRRPMPCRSPTPEETAAPASVTHTHDQRPGPP